MDAIAFDINLSPSTVLNNANGLTRKAAERYYSNASGRIAIKRQVVETVDSIETARDIISSILLNRTYQQTPVTTITQAPIPTVTTTLAHNLVDKNIVVFKNANGMVQVNNNFYYVKVLTDNTFELFSDEPTGRLALVFELMDMNMYDAIKGKRHYLPENRVKYYMY